MDSDRIGPDIEERLGQVIGEAFGQARMVATKWLVMVEAVDTGPGDDMLMWSFTSPNVRSWDTKGMLAHGMDIERARTFGYVTGMMDNGDEDGDE